MDICNGPYRQGLNQTVKWVLDSLCCWTGKLFLVKPMQRDFGYLLWVAGVCRRFHMFGGL